MPDDVKVSQSSGDGGDSGAVPVWLARARKWGTWLEDIVLPPACGGCGRRGTWMCQSCALRLRAMPDNVCRCGLPHRSDGQCARTAGWPAGLVEMRAAFQFSGPMRESIHRLKYGGEYARGPMLGELLATQVETHWRVLPPPDLVMPIPLFPRRQRQRGYNQSAILAKSLGQRLGFEVATYLRRQVDTRPQVGLGASDRRKNVADAFTCDVPSGRLEDLHVLLIDDVVTTGATMEAAARTVLAAGAIEVTCLALARQFGRD